MLEFKIEADALRREMRFRMLSWGTVVLLIGVTVLLFVFGVLGDLNAYESLSWLFVFTSLGAVIGICILACYEALHYAERQMVFVLGDRAVIRKRQGYPDVKIPFSEINTLGEELGRLIIVSVEPRRKIGIPYSVSGYEKIRTELSKHCPISARTKFPWREVILPMITLVSWGAVLSFRDVPGIIAAGVVALFALAWASYRLWVMLRHNSKRPLLLWASLGSIWLAAIVLIYIRVERLLI